MRQDGAPDNTEAKAPHEAILDLPQERITGDILRGHGPRRGNLETLIKYWRPIMRKPGGFRRCLVILADHPELYPLERICAWLHHETTGMWPNEGNHHAGGKLGKIKRVVKKPRRKRRGKSYELEAGIDIPIERIEQRLEQKAGSILYAPLDGTQEQIDFKSSKGTRVLKAVESILLPGEHGALKPRHLLATSLTPGGSGAPGPKLRIGPGRAIRAGTGKTRGFRCPPGFERGGHFTDSRFSTCGRQLFGIPGSSRTALRTVAVAANRNTGQPREKVGLAYAEYKAATPTAGVGGGMPKLPDTVGPANPGKQSSMVSKVLKSMSSVSDATDAPIRRLIREDGSILQPLAPLNIIGKQKNNSDLKNAALITRINAPGAFGADELALMQTGLKSIEFSLPGGGSVSLKRNGGVMAPGKARAFGKAIAAARRAGGADADYAAILRETAAKTNAVTYSINLPGESNPGRVVRVKGGGGEKHVPYWVYKTFLAEGAPGKAKDTPAHTMAEAVGKSLKATAVKRLGQETLTTWGPLQYTAALIPDYDEIDRTAGVAFKASAYAAYRNDISWAFVEEKRGGSVWDRGISRFRCPPGTPDAGQITNRVGLGCAAAVANRMLEAFRGARRDIGEATMRANRARRGDIAQRGKRKPAKPFRNVTNVGPHIQIDRGLANRIEGVLNIDGTPDFGILAQRRGVDDKRPGLLRRLANVFDVPIDNLESAALRRDRGDRRIGLLRRAANVFDVPANDEESRALAAARAIRPEDDKRVGMLRRIANVFDPVKIRTGRDGNLLPTGQRFKPDVEMVDWNRLAARSQHDLMDMSWKRRIGKNVLEDGDHRNWLLENGPDLDTAEFTRLENEVLDIEVFREAFKGPDENLAATLDKLSPEVHGFVNADALRRKVDFDAQEAAQLSLERRNRNNLGLNLPDGFSVDEAALNKIDQYQARSINRRLEQHQDDIDRKIARVKEGKLNKIGVDRHITDLVNQRDKYRAAAAKNEGNLDAGGNAQQYIADITLAEMYDRALPEFVDEARRFERLDALKRDKDNGLGVLVFNDPAELANVPLPMVPKVNQREHDEWIIGIGNANDLDELGAVSSELVVARREADEAVAGYNVMLKDIDLSDEQIAKLAKARGEAAWQGEIARRAEADISVRRAELRGPNAGIYENPERLNGKLGAYDAEGNPIIASVPVGNAGINSQSSATAYLSRGGDLADVPDAYLVEAIKSNPDRFKSSRPGANNIGQVVKYMDKETGREFFTKVADNGAHETIAEILANQLAGDLGFPVGAMRIGGEPRNGMVPLVFEHSNGLAGGDRWMRADAGRGELFNKKALDDPKTVVRGLMLDYLVNNGQDRHHQNWFIATGDDGKRFFVPIDHGVAFTGFGRKEPPKDKKFEEWDDSRMSWTNVLGYHLKQGDYTPEELADEFEDAVAGLDNDKIDAMIGAMDTALPSGYDHNRRGRYWRDDYSALLHDRANAMNGLSRAELVEWASNLLNDPDMTLPVPRAILKARDKEHNPW